MAWLWKQVGKVDQGIQYLKQAASNDAASQPSSTHEEDEVDLRMVLGFYLIECQKAKEALTIFESLVKADPTRKSALAGLVMAAAVVDPNLAQQYSKHLSALTPTPTTGTSTSSTAFGADLEQLSSFFGTHVARGGAGSKAASVAFAVTAGAKQKKQRKATRKHKPRRLPKDFDPAVKPDPERWIPKRMRASEVRRRRKGKGKHDAVAKGPQGAVSQADDEATTSAAPAATTAHANAPVAAAPAAAASANKKKKKKSKW